MQASFDTPPGTPVIDAAFAYQPGGALQAPAGCDAGDAWRHLTSAVARDPLDLEAHVRRIVLATRERSSGHVFTALIDLFLALGLQGRELRALMLATARDALTPDEAAFFEQALEPGLARSAGLPMGTQSVLDPGLMGAVEMVAQARRAVAQQSVAEQAAELVNHGDLEGARQMLEVALMENPDDTAASQELLAIYRYSRDTQAENLMRERLTTRFGRTPAAWA